MRNQEITGVKKRQACNDLKKIGSGWYFCQRRLKRERHILFTKRTTKEQNDVDSNMPKFKALKQFTLFCYRDI